MPLAAARAREGARDPVRGVSTVLRDSGADRRRRTCRQSIAGQPFGWPARASRTVGRGSHPKDRSAIGIGSLAAPPLPHHRAYGAASTESGVRARHAPCGLRSLGRALRASPFSAPRPAPTGCSAAMSVAVLLTLSVVRAFAGEPATMPSADFCAAVTGLADPLSPGLPDTAQTSRATDRLHRIPAGFTTPALDGCGLRDSALARPAG